MAFFSIFIMSSVFMFFIFSIFVTLLIIKRIGMTLLAGKLKIRNYGLLWVPGLAALYDAKIINKFLDWGKIFEIGYFTIITITKMTWLILMWFGPSYNQPSFDVYNSIHSDISFIIFLIDAVFKSIILKKIGYKTFVSFIIGIFLSPFWCFFAIIKRKR